MRLYLCGKEQFKEQLKFSEEHSLCEYIIPSSDITQLKEPLLPRNDILIPAYVQFVSKEEWNQNYSLPNLY